jgi:hypothetical protein
MCLIRADLTEYVKISRKKISTRTRPEMTMSLNSSARVAVEGYSGTKKLTSPPLHQSGYAQNHFTSYDQRSHTVNGRTSQRSFKADSLSFDEPHMTTSYPAEVRIMPRSMFPCSAHSREGSFDSASSIPASPESFGDSTRNERPSLAARKAPSGLVPRTRDVEKRESPKRASSNERSPIRNSRQRHASPGATRSMSPPKIEKISYFHAKTCSTEARNNTPMNIAKHRAKRLHDSERDVVVNDLPPVPSSPDIERESITHMTASHVDSDDLK